MRAARDRPRALAIRQRHPWCTTTTAAIRRELVYYVRRPAGIRTATTTTTAVVQVPQRRMRITGAHRYRTTHAYTDDHRAITASDCIPRPRSCSTVHTYIIHCNNIPAGYSERFDIRRPSVHYRAVILWRRRVRTPLKTENSAAVRPPLRARAPAITRGCGGRAGWRAGGLADARRHYISDHQLLGPYR